MGTAAVSMLQVWCSQHRLALLLSNLFPLLHPHLGVQPPLFIHDPFMTRDCLYLGSFFRATSPTAPSHEPLAVDAQGPKPYLFRDPSYLHRDGWGHSQMSWAPDRRIHLERCKVRRLRDEGYYVRSQLHKCWTQNWAQVWPSFYDFVAG